MNMRGLFTTLPQGGRKGIFRGPDDYERFKHYLNQAEDKYDFFLHGYVLITNHYHLIMETLKGNLHQIMHYLNGSYTTHIQVSPGFFRGLGRR